MTATNAFVLLGFACCVVESDLSVRALGDLVAGLLERSA